MAKKKASGGMKYRATPGSVAFTIITVALFTIFTVICIFAFYYLFINTISDNALVGADMITLLPKGIHFNNYLALRGVQDFGNSVLITVSRTILATSLMVLCSAFAGYLTTKREMWKRSFWYRALVITMYFNAGTIPWYLNMLGLGLTDNYLGYIIPAIVAPYNIILVKTYVESIPASLEESATIDGAGTLQVFTKIIWSGAQTGWCATMFKDLFNVELNIIPDTDGAYQTRMEKGDLGDIVIWGNNGEQYLNAVKAGLLFDWEEDLLDNYGQYIKETFPEALEANREISGDGHVYGTGYALADRPDQHDAFIYDWGIRWDLYKELGYPEVKDLDDMVELLGKMKEICPTGDDGKNTYGMSIWSAWDGNMAMYAKALASAYYGYDELGYGLYNSQNGEFYDCLDPNGPYVEALRFFNKLYQKGLLDPDSMTQTYENMMAKTTNGNVFFSIFDYAGSQLFNTEKHVSENKFMCPLVPSDASVPAWGLSEGGNDRIWSIGANTLYPEKCMQIINWLHTPEGAMTIWYGIKGLMWDYDANGGTVFTDLGRTCYFAPTTDLAGTQWTSPYSGESYTLDGTFNDGKLQANNITWGFGAENPDSAAGECFHYSTWQSFLGEPQNDTEKDWRERVDADGIQAYMNTTNYTVVPVVSTYHEPERDAELELKWNQVKTTVVNGSWNAMYAKSDAEFDSIVSQMKKDADSYGYEDCVSWCRERAAEKFAMQDK